MIAATNKQKAQAQAVAQAVARLRDKGLAHPASIRLFGQALHVAPPDFEVVTTDGTPPAFAADRILALHYLLADPRPAPSGDFISFRDLPGGQFYWEPYRSRSVVPLAKRVGNDLDLLKARLSVFDWRPVDLGDFAAALPVVDRIEAVLVYHLGDEDFAPEANLLFDASVRRIFNTEDIAVIGTRICAGLFSEPCRPCAGCGICDLRKGYLQGQGAIDS